MKLNQIISQIVLLFEMLANCFCFESRILLFRGFSDCPDGERNPARFTGTVTNITQNVYGEVEIEDFLTAPLEVYSRINSQQLCILINH